MVELELLTCAVLGTLSATMEPSAIAAGSAELYREYKELYTDCKARLEEEKAAHASTKAEHTKEKEAHAATKVELARFKAEPAAGKRRAAGAAAARPASRRRTDDANEVDVDTLPPFKGGNATGKMFTDEEDERYLALLNKYGQPKKANPSNWKEAFGRHFPERSLQSWAAHVNAFNVGEYKAWQAANPGRWVADAGGDGDQIHFQWRKN